MSPPGDIVPPPQPGEVVVCVADRAPSPDPSPLPPAERERALAIAHPRSRDRFVGGRLLLRRLLARVLGPAGLVLPVIPDARGAPCLAEPGAALHLSISHGATRDAVALALAPVGIDVEEEAPPDFGALCETILSAGEMAAMSREPAAARAAAFLGAWTRKEAVLKAAGTGFLVDPRGVETFWGPGEARVRASVLPHPVYAVADIPGPVAVALAGETIAVRAVAP